MSVETELSKTAHLYIIEAATKNQMKEERPKLEFRKTVLRQPKQCH